MPSVDSLNALSAANARAEFLRCCGATRWADLMTARRPFANEAELFGAASECFVALTRSDWLEAFAAHPKIGDVDSLRSKFAHTAAWSAQEQGAMSAAAEATIQGLAAGNRDYEAKFGHIFIVCARGKTAAEMLALLDARLPNSADDELRNAAAEQEKITHLRLQRSCS